VIVTNYRDFRKELVQAAVKQKIPLLGEFELTGACNLSCTMCYVHETGRPAELSTRRWKAIFDEAVREGMLFALLTGGECLLRSDFTELYDYLFDLGVRITVFTNGTLIDETIASCFAKRPPDFVAITVYGASNKTYEEVTGNPRGFDQLNRGLDFLKLAGTRVMLRTVPLHPLYRDLDDIIAFAKGRELLLGYAMYIGPTRNLEHKEQDLRLKPIDLILFEKKIKDAFGFASNQDFSKSDDGFRCAALRSSIFVTWNGYLQPCAMLNHPKKKLKDGELLSTMRELGALFEELDHCQDCATCEVSSSCVQCYARRFLEGNAKTCQPYLKAIATLRRKTS
jgi:MoaA/NifB/PqqE/SkfB family radical SAM enzyme